MSRFPRATRSEDDRPRPLRPALWRVRPRTGPDRGRVLLQDHREDGREQRSHLHDARDRDQGGAGRPGQAPPRRALARLLQARAPREGPEPARAVLEREQAGQQGQGVDRHRRREEAPRPDRRDRRRLEGDRRRGEDPGCRPAQPDLDPNREPRPTAGLRRVRGAGRRSPIRERLRGPWRVAVSERSMAPGILPGDWLLVDPTVARWPRRGSIVVFREPDRRPAGDQARGRPSGRPRPARRRVPRPRRRRGLAALGRAGRGAASSWVAAHPSIPAGTDP